MSNFFQTSVRKIRMNLNKYHMYVNLSISYKHNLHKVYAYG